MRTDILERRLATIKENGLPLPKLLFDIPDFHNPNGYFFVAGKKKKILELALEHNFVIVEDDPYNDYALREHRYHLLNQWIIIILLFR